MFRVRKLLQSPRNCLLLYLITVKFFIISSGVVVAIGATSLVPNSKIHVVQFSFRDISFELNGLAGERYFKQPPPPPPRPDRFSKIVDVLVRSIASVAFVPFGEIPRLRHYFSNLSFTWQRLVPNLFLVCTCWVICRFLEYILRKCLCERCLWTN